MFRVYKYLILAQNRVYACTCKQERGGKSKKNQRILARLGFYMTKMREQYNNAAIMFPNVSKFHNIDTLQLN